MSKPGFPLIMRTLALSTAVTALLMAGLFRVYASGWMLSCAITFGTAAYHFLMRLAVGYALPRLTRYAFDYRSRWFQPRRWEPAFYARLKIRSWKGALPTYAPQQFSLKTNSLHRVIQNMCGAEIVHEIIMVLSFLPVLAVPRFGALPVFLITSILSALYDSIFVMAQRYNRPRLVRIYEKQEAKGL